MNSLPLKKVYRVVNVNGPEHLSCLSGGGIKSRLPWASCSLPDHLIRGSGSSWNGSQFISTTSNLDVAVKFAAPMNRILCIDIPKFISDGGKKYFDLSTKESFERYVPKTFLDEENESISDKYLESFVIDDLFDLSQNETVTQRDARYLLTKAAKSPWECARLFSTRSEELLLVGEIPADCISILNYTVTTTRVDHLCKGNRIPVSSLEELVPENHSGGGNSGRTICKILGDLNEYQCKQAKPNVQSEMLDERDMSFSIDAEFAAFDFYRLVEENSPHMGVNVRDCVKIAFDVTIKIIEMNKAKFLKYSLKCLVFKTPANGLKPVRIGWFLMPKSNIDGLPMSNISFPYFPKKSFVTKSEILKRWRSNPTIYNFKEGIKHCLDDSADDAVFLIGRTVAPYALPSVMKGLAVDIFLSNVYGWGTFDECQLSEDLSGKI